jgi:Leucine-rich repeat (LRR) protein
MLALFKIRELLKPFYIYNMIRLLAVLGFTVLSLQTSARQQFPLFKAHSDSLKYAQLVNQLQTRWDDTVKLNVDSLYKEMDVLRKKVVGWGQFYKPKKGFVSYADLKSGKANADTITRLSISDFRAARIPPEVLLCKNLEELELVNTRIDELQDELNSLTRLSSIYLFNNVPDRRLILGKNDQVNYLRIAGHHPDKLPKSYKNFTSLDSLNLNRSMSVRIPDIRKNKQLTILNAVGNNITLKGYKKSSSLQHLDLRMNKVTKVRGSISRKYPALLALSFNANPVKKVKPGLGRLINLQYLSFYGNMLTEIPPPVYRLKNLQTIDLFNNQIEAVSPEIKNLQKLEVLYLANNKLYSLPEEIGMLKSLQELYVYNNRMDTLPASMNTLENLRVLWVNDNFFHTIPATTWRVKNLDYLDASQNFIQRVPDEIIQASKLGVLILSGALMNKERDNPALFQKLRQQGTRIIYYTQGEL